MTKTRLRRISQDLWEEIEKERERQGKQNLNISRVQASHLLALKIQNKLREKPKKKWKRGKIILDQF